MSEQDELEKYNEQLALEHYSAEAEAEAERQRVEHLAGKIVDAVLDNLCGRSGIGDAIEGCDKPIRDAMRIDLVELVERKLTLG